MKTQKSKFNLLERRRFLFLEIGLIIVLSAVLLAFSYRTYPSDRIVVSNPYGDVFNEDHIIQTKQPKPTPPPPVKPVSIINIVDGPDIDPEPIEIDVETGQDDPMPLWEPPKPEEEVIVERDPFIPVEIEPEFPGGYPALLEFLSRQIKYPEMAKAANVQGTVHVSFIVMPDGSVSNIEVIRGIGGGCDEEAVRVVKLMPKWKPGIQAGKPVKRGLVIPIKFRLMN
ncbi:MAG: energy transducer TonB [Bacteroidales bacterium]